MKESVNKEFKGLGTDIYLEIVLPDQYGQVDMARAKTHLEAAQEIVAQKEKVLSRFNQGSELNKFNNNLGKFFSASPDLHYLAGKSLYYYDATGRLFDPRVIIALEGVGYDRDFKLVKENSNKINKDIVFKNAFNKVLREDLIINGQEVCFKKRMDFSGIAKGYINDQISGFLKSRGWQNYLVDTGGDIFAAGKDREGEDWAVEVENSDKNAALLIKLKNQAVATSGITRRNWEKEGKVFHHLVNPLKPDEFTTEFLSLSLVAATAEEADVWAKVLFLMGEGVKAYIEKNKMKAVILFKSGEVWQSF